MRVPTNTIDFSKNPKPSKSTNNKDEFSNKFNDLISSTKKEIKKTPDNTTNNLGELKKELKDLLKDNDLIDENGNIVDESKVLEFIQNFLSTQTQTPANAQNLLHEIKVDLFPISTTAQSIIPVIIVPTEMKAEQNRKVAQGIQNALIDGTVTNNTNTSIKSELVVASDVNLNIKINNQTPVTNENTSTAKKSEATTTQTQLLNSQVRTNVTNEKPVSNVMQSQIVSEDDAVINSENATLPKLNPNSEIVGLNAIKVGENTKLTDVMPKESLDDMTAKIITNIKDGVKEFNIALNPKELGEINVKISFESTKISVLVSCENTKTQNLMLASKGDLRSIIENNFATPVVVEVDENNQRQDYTEQENNDDTNKNQETKQQKNKSDDGQVFLQQLRLGLVNLENIK